VATRRNTSTTAKYGICLTAGVVLELGGLWLLLLAAMLSPCHSPHPPPPMPTTLTFIFPYLATVATVQSTTTDVVALLTLFQMPMYGFILAWAWSRKRFGLAFLLLGSVHL